MPRKSNVNVLRKARSSSNRRYSTSSNPITKHTNIHRCQIERDNIEVKALFSYLSHLYRAGCGVEEASPRLPQNVAQNQHLSSISTHKVDDFQSHNLFHAAADATDVIHSKVTIETPLHMNSEEQILSPSMPIITEEEVLNNLFFSNYPFLDTACVTEDLCDDDKRLLISENFAVDSEIMNTNEKASNRDDKYSHSVVSLESVYTPFLKSGFLPLHTLLKDLPGVQLNEKQKYMISPFLAAMKYLESVNKGFSGMNFTASQNSSGTNENVVQKKNEISRNSLDEYASNDSSRNGEINSNVTNLDKYNINANDINRDDINSSDIYTEESEIPVSMCIDTTTSLEIRNIGDDKNPSPTLKNISTSQNILNDHNMSTYQEIPNYQNNNSGNFYRNNVLEEDIMHSVKGCGIFPSQYQSVDLVQYYKSLFSNTETMIDIATSTSQPLSSPFGSPSPCVIANTCNFLGPDMPPSPAIHLAINYLNSLERSVQTTTERSSINVVLEESIEDNDIIISSVSGPLILSNVCNTNENERNNFSAEISLPISYTPDIGLIQKNVLPSSQCVPTSSSSTFTSSRPLASSFSNFYLAASSSSLSSSLSSPFKMDNFISNISCSSSGSISNKTDDLQMNSIISNDDSSSSSSSSNNGSGDVGKVNNNGSLHLLNVDDENRNEDEYQNGNQKGYQKGKILTDCSLLLSLIPPLYLSDITIAASDTANYKNKLKFRSDHYYDYNIDNNSSDKDKNIKINDNNNRDNDNSNIGFQNNNSNNDNNNNDNNDEEEEVEENNIRLCGLENAIKYFQFISKSSINNPNSSDNSDFDNTSSEECSSNSDDPTFEDSSSLISLEERSAALAALTDLSESVHLSRRILDMKSYPLWGNVTQLQGATYTQNMGPNHNNSNIIFSDLLLSMELDLLTFGEMVRDLIRRSKYPLSISFSGDRDGGSGTLLTPVYEIDRREIVKNSNLNHNWIEDYCNINVNSNGSSDCDLRNGTSSPISPHYLIQPLPLPSVQSLLSLQSIQSVSSFDPLLPSNDDTSGAIALLALMSDCVCFNEFDCYFSDVKNIDISNNNMSTISREKNQYKGQDIDDRITDFKSTESRKRKFADDPTHCFSTSRRQQKCPKCGEFKKGHICTFNRENDFFYPER